MVDLKKCETCYNHYHLKYREWFCDYFNKCEGNNKYKPYTNGDMIRQMDDGQLAELFSTFAKCHVGQQGIEDWLKEAVKIDY